MVYAFPFDQNLHSQRALPIYTAELAASHWNCACRVTVIFKLLLVTIMIGDRGHQNAFARANLTFLHSPIVKLKRSREGGREGNRRKADCCAMWLQKRKKVTQECNPVQGAALSPSFTELTFPGSTGRKTASPRARWIRKTAKVKWNQKLTSFKGRNKRSNMRSVSNIHKLFCLENGLQWPVGLLRIFLHQMFIKHKLIKEAW